MGSRPSLHLSWVEGMSFGPLVRLVMKPFDVRLELPAIDPPDASAADLDGWELARPDERIDLRNAHVEEVGNVLKCHEPWFEAETLRYRAGGVIHVEPKNSTCSPRIPDFDSICSCLTPLAWGRQIWGV